MEGIVTKLFDIDDIVFPSELLDITVDEARIDEKVALLSLKYAVQSEVDTAGPGDTVYCRADQQSYPDGRTILLFTGAPLPDAQDASQKAIGRSVGDTFDAMLCETNTTLTIQKIVHRTPAQITDGLIASLGIENVTTIPGYKAYLRDLELEEQKSQQARMAVQFALQALVRNSEFSYDEAEMDAQIQSILAQQGTDEEAPGFEIDAEEMKELAAMQIKQGWVARAYCESKGIAIDVSGMDEEIDAAMEMQVLMGGPALSREEYAAMFLENQYLAKLFEALNTKIQSVMEG